MHDYIKLDAYIAVYHRQQIQLSASPNGHGTRVANLCVRFAEHMSYDKEFIKQIGYAGSIHDAGKMTIPIEILEKRGALTPNEWLIVKSHPHRAYEVLEDLNLTDNSISLMVLYHHLNYDGTGYPVSPLHGQSIPLGARISTSLIDMML